MHRLPGAARGTRDDGGSRAKIRALGEMTARMHQCADSMSPPYRRKHLDMRRLVDRNMAAIAALMKHRAADYAVIGGTAEDSKDRIGRLLGRAKPEYGACHGDLHGGDVCPDGNNVPTPFDFDS